ncbi:hypothetical protein HDU81_001028, partial [Chytriomyces hyalinus]
MKSFRPLGLEYYNLCNLHWARLSMDNMDIQFLINSSTRKSTAYTIKYTFKRQSLESSAIMRIGLYTQNVASVISWPDNDVITLPERSLRIINKFLYSLTKPVEVCTTMAAYLILSDGALFESSHQFVYRSLSLLNACYPDVPDPLQDQSTDEFVDLSIPLSSINSDSYHIVKGKGNTGNHWVQNAFSERKVLIVTGRQLPNLAKDLATDDLSFYYKSMLVLFKPHQSVDGLLFYPDQSYKDAYFQFLDTAPTSLADAAILHEELNQNHYENNEKDYQQEETDEDCILREHPLQDEFAEDIPFPKNAVHPNEDPTLLQNFEEELANAFAKTVLEDSNKIDPHLDAALSLSVHSTPPPPVATLPIFTTMQSYLS